MLHDLRYALRNLRQNPGFTLVATLSLALGIGANAAMFSFADALILRPLPVKNASGIVTVQAQMRGESIARFSAFYPLSYPDYVDLRDRTKSFAGLTAAMFSSFGFAPAQGALPQMKFGELVSGNFFSVLQVQPDLGRAFRPDEDQVRGRDAVVVLGHDFWKNDLSGNPDVVGRTIFLNSIAFTVIGVAPKDFAGSSGLIHSAMFIPLSMAPRLGGDARKTLLEQRDNRTLTVRGRLQPGVSVSQAAAEARVIGQQLAQAYPATNRTASLLATSDQAARMQQDPYDAILVFFLIGLAMLVLLIACANVMNLILSRAQSRSREIAVRLAIGAGRGRLIRQLLTESLIIALLGGAAGVLLAQFGIDLLSQLRIPSAIPIVIDVKLDTRVLLFALLSSMASALVFGLAPALKSSNPDLAPALKSGKGESGKRRRLLGRNGLVVAQVAGSLVLLVFATQAYRGASMILSAPVGFRTDHLLIANFDPSLARYTLPEGKEFYKGLLDRVRALPEVKSAALAQGVPMGVNGGASRIVPEGVQLPPGADAILVLSTDISDGYFETMGIPITEGRDFHRTDGADAPLVAIVNDLFAQKYYPKQSAIGKRIRLIGPDGGTAEIIGVAKRSKYAFIVEPAIDYLYLPAAQRSQKGMTLLLHTAGPPADVAGPLRQVVRSIDPGQPVFGVSTMAEFFDQRAKNMLNMLIRTIAGMGILGLVLALVGLYGLISYSVGLRHREIGIRMAIGAEPAGVLRMVLKQGLVLAGIGIAIGGVISVMAGKPVTNLIETDGFNLPLLMLVAIGLLVATACGAFIPARRASLVDPNRVLRQD